LTDFSCAGFELHFQRDELDFVMQKIGLKYSNLKAHQQAKQASDLSILHPLPYCNRLLFANLLVRSEDMIFRKQ
jgi:hypothetical protein